MVLSCLLLHVCVLATLFGGSTTQLCTDPVCTYTWTVSTRMTMDYGQYLSYLRNGTLFYTNYYTQGELLNILCKHAMLSSHCSWCFLLYYY
jgi:hypothetical protein